jgi:zinc protease
MMRSSLAIFFVLFVAANIFAQTPQATPPPPASPRSGKFPTPTEQTLTNGLRVIVIERHESPLISAQLLIKNGGEVDPAEMAGLADMTANLLTKGTQSRDATKIAQEIESLGGSLDSGARWDSSYATVSVMSSKIQAAMEILADVVRHPTFKSDEVERLRQQNLDNFTLGARRSGIDRALRCRARRVWRRPIRSSRKRHDRVAHAYHCCRHHQNALALLPA